MPSIADQYHVRELVTKETLERFIDCNNIAELLEIVGTICREKEQHIRENWQDEALADVWERAAYDVERAAGSNAVRRVSR